MRKLFITLAFLTLPLMGGAALAASDNGVVRSVDTRTGILQLADGASYYVPNRLTLSRLQKGDTVRVQFDRTTGHAVASDVERTGRSQGAVPVVSPTRGNPVNKNFVTNSKMCDATADDKNPCYNVGGQ